MASIESGFPTWDADGKFLIFQKPQSLSLPAHFLSSKSSPVFAKRASVTSRINIDPNGPF